MCGLISLFEPGRNFPEGLVRAMADDIRHRGPDSDGFAAEPGWALGFRRLAIIDPTDDSNQPMHDRHGRITLVFNGEIYNYAALRRELAETGVRFRAHGDTEVILEGYRAWGEAVFDRLEGMYALCLVDRDRNLGLAARDPMGIKPLYMLRNGQQTAFASEMWPLHRLKRPEVDENALAELLTFGWAAGRVSNCRNIDRVPGGTVVTVDLADGSVRERRFANVLDTIEPGPEIPEDQVQDAIETAVRDHLVSDVGYSLQLSGGVDSSLVAALAATTSRESLKSYSIGIENYEHDESPYQDMVVERYGLQHFRQMITGRDYADILPAAVRHMEGPTPHGGCTMLMLLCRSIRDDFKVVLTGEGADELFGGYLRYGDWKRLAMQEMLGRYLPVNRLPDVWPLRGARRLAGHDNAAWAHVYHDFRLLSGAFPELVPGPTAREAASARFSEFRDRLFAVDQSTYLESLLVRQDKMSMAMSVEARVPFVHWPLFRLVNRMNRRQRAPGGQTKPVLKRLADRFLPRELVHRRKIGLWLPYEKWFGDPSQAGAHVDMVLDADSRLCRFGERTKVRGLVDRLRRGRRQDGLTLQRLVETELWLRELDRPIEGTTDYAAGRPRAAA